MLAINKKVGTLLWGISTQGTKLCELPVFRYYHKGLVNTSFVYGWVNEKFEINGKTFNSKTDFTELYATLKAEIDLAGLEWKTTKET